MLDLLSAVIGAIAVGVPLGVFLLWVAAKAYYMGWKDRDQGKWIGNKEKKWDEETATRF